MPAIRDAAHLLALRGRLWEGRASILVGSGFSRGAVTVDPNVSAPPLWGGVLRDLRSDLYPYDAGSAPDDPLRLAEEYETTLSRDALHERLASSINDQAHEPGPNHELLLKLPWSDVFTTNYDTLLERARLKSGRRYSIVRSPQALPQSTAPRIVKLHGSLPDNYPLIITEEDYRKYPQTHGAFVSLVRTRLVEHSLVMVGFSGDDPNFLRWSGWVRDHLGENAPPLYLVTVGLSNPKRTLFEKRGIAPIDLAEAFRDFSGETDQLHRKALNSFLCEMYRGMPHKPDEWPKKREIRVPEHVRLLEDDDDTKQAPKPFGKTPGPVTVGETARGYSQETELTDLVKPWRQERKTYPGWVVAPSAVRDRIWRNTKEWHDPFFRDIETVSEPNDLQLAREFVWRLNVALIPVTGDEVNALYDVLNRYNPFPGKLEYTDSLSEQTQAEQEGEGEDSAIKRLTPERRQNWNWAELRSGWTELALTVLRALRIGGHEHEFEVWKETLKSVTRGTEATARFWKEVAHYYMDRQQIGDVMKVIGTRSKAGRWPRTNEEFPMGEVWRSSFLAEVGKMDDSLGLIEDVLQRINQSLAHNPSLPVRSQERWARQLFKYLEYVRNPFGERSTATDRFPKWGESNEDSEEAATRFEELHRYINKPIPEKRGIRSASFDIGRYSQSFSFSGDYPFEEHRHGVAYIRLFEEGGIPFRISGSPFDSKNLERACQWARPITPFSSYVALIRNAGKEAVAPMTRRRISGLAKTDATGLAEILERACRHVAQHARSDDAAAKRLSPLLNVYSRVAIVSSGLAATALAVGIEIAEAVGPDEHWATYDKLGRFIRRTAAAVTDSKLAEYVPSLLDIPLGGRDRKTKGGLQFWFEPFRSLRDVTLDDVDIPSSTIEALLSVLESTVGGSIGTDPETEWKMAQAFAAARLNYLYINRGLKPNEEKRLAEAFWGLTGPSGIPDLSWTRIGFALSMPDPLSGKTSKERVEEVFEERLRHPETESEFAELNGAQFLVSLLRITRLRSAKNESGPQANRTEWSIEAIKNILTYLRAYWEKRKQGYAKAKKRDEGGTPPIFSRITEFEREVSLIPVVLADVVGASLPVGEIEEWDDLRQLTEDLEANGLETARVYPLLKFADTGRVRARLKIRKALGSYARDNVKEAAEAIYIWCKLHDSGDLSEPPRPLLKDLVRYIAVNGRPGLSPAMIVMTRIVEQHGNLVSDGMVDDLLLGLDLLYHSDTLPTQQDAWTNPNLSELEIDNRDDGKEATRLASTLHRRFRNSNQLVPEILELWKEAATISNLPEIRRAW